MAGLVTPLRSKVIAILPEDSAVENPWRERADFRPFLGAAAPVPSCARLDFSIERNLAFDWDIRGLVWGKKEHHIYLY